jgi:hypothetical protein
MRLDNCSLSGGGVVRGDRFAEREEVEGMLEPLKSSQAPFGSAMEHRVSLPLSLLVGGE